MKWANNAGLSLDSSGALPEVLAIACSTSDKVKLPPGYPIGDFTPAQPGSGNSFQIATKKNSYTWQFNWKLAYSVTANGQTKIYDLPAGTYVVRIKSGVTKQEDPRLPTRAMASR